MHSNGKSQYNFFLCCFDLEDWVEKNSWLHVSLNHSFSLFQGFWLPIVEDLMFKQVLLLYTTFPVQQVNRDFSAILICIPFFLMAELDSFLQVNVQCCQESLYNLLNVPAHTSSECSLWQLVALRKLAKIHSNLLSLLTSIRSARYILIKEKFFLAYYNSYFI